MFVQGKPGWELCALAWRGRKGRLCLAHWADCSRSRNCCPVAGKVRRPSGPVGSNWCRGPLCPLPAVTPVRPHHLGALAQEGRGQARSARRPSRESARRWGGRPESGTEGPAGAWEGWAGRPLWARGASPWGPSALGSDGAVQAWVWIYGDATVRTMERPPRRPPPTPTREAGPAHPLPCSRRVALPADSPISRTVPGHGASGREPSLGQTHLRLLACSNLKTLKDKNLECEPGLPPQNQSP